jgi:ABC-type anion transport system duplicated permease subunit
VVGKHLAGQSRSQRLQQSDGAAAGLAIATSPATMAYVTTETGVVTMIIMVVVAAYLLTRRAADFAKAEPKTSAADRQTAHCRTTCGSE